MITKEHKKEVSKILRGKRGRTVWHNYYVTQDSLKINTKKNSQKRIDKIVSLLTGYGYVRGRDYDVKYKEPQNEYMRKYSGYSFIVSIFH